MKKLFITLMLTISFNAFSSTIIRLDGNFKFTNASLLQARDVEIVDGRNQTRLKELMAEHFQCFSAGGSFRCQQFVKLNELPTSISDKISNEWESSVVSFKKSNLDPELTNEAESLIEWDVFDSFVLGNAKSSNYHYYLIDDVLHKIKIETSENTFWFNITSADQIYTLSEKSTRINKSRVRYFTVSVNFIRN